MMDNNATSRKKNSLSTVQTVLSQVVENLGLNNKANELAVCRLWPQAVQQVTQNAELVQASEAFKVKALAGGLGLGQIDGYELHVRVQQAPYASALSLYQPQLLAFLNQYQRQTRIVLKRLQFQTRSF